MDELNSQLSLLHDMGSAGDAEGTGNAGDAGDVSGAGSAGRAENTLEQRPGASSGVSNASSSLGSAESGVSQKGAAPATERPRATALYREWRPRRFADVVEQAHVVKTLKNSILHNRLAHAYLFCGTRGTGKTTLAQILSRAVNCLNPSDAEPCNECEICQGILSGRILDVMEIDAASNNSVDNVRNLRDSVIYSPAQAKYKVYIIDEVHMLSGGAFNALLKTLEEPPPYVIFILATTEPHKLPATIISRCQRFDFRRITDAAIVERLKVIAGQIGAEAEDGALRMIAKLSEGALRDAISIFDQCASSPHVGAITLDDVLRITGRPADDNLLQGAKILVNKEISAIPGHVAGVASAGTPLAQYIDGMTEFFRNLLMIKLGHGREAFPELRDGVFEETRDLAERCGPDYLLAAASEFSMLAGVIKGSSNQIVMLEVALAKICLGRFRSAGAVESLNARVEALEKRLEAAEARGAAAQSAAAYNTEAQGGETYRTAEQRGAAHGATEQHGAAQETTEKRGPAQNAERRSGAAQSGTARGAEMRRFAAQDEAAQDEAAQDEAARDEAAYYYPEADIGGLEAAEYTAVLDGQYELEPPDNNVAADTAAPADHVTATRDDPPMPDNNIPQKPNEKPVVQSNLQSDVPQVAQPSDTSIAQPSEKPIDNAVWSGIIQKFKDQRYLQLFSILQGTSARTVDNNFYIVLTPDGISHKKTLSNPDNMLKIRGIIQAATGREYTVHVTSGQTSFNDIAKKMRDKFNIDPVVHP